ncbi:SEL1-like repeat protein [bacterium]|nr:SEL1-like repeat protein [bacterium]
MSNDSKRSGVSITTVILLMVITALSVAVVMLLLERKNNAPITTVSIEEKAKAILADDLEAEETEIETPEEKAEETLVVEEKKEETPDVEEKIEEMLIADELEKEEIPPVVEEKEDENAKAEAEEILIAEAKEEKEEIPAPSKELANVETNKAKPDAESVRVDPAELTRKGDKESLTEAARLGYLPAQVKLGRLYEENREYESAAYWYELAAQQSDPEANEKIGRYYLFEIGGKEKNVETALKYLANAAYAGRPGAMTLLGNYNYYLKKYDYALGWYKNAAAKDDTEALYKLGLMYEYGDGVAEDHPAAFKYFQTAADKGHIDAWINLGIDYLIGRGTDKNLAKANQWIGKAANAGKPAAQKLMGDIYYNGWGVPDDRKTAISWYEKAAQGGSALAKEKLAQVKAAETKVRKKPVKPQKKRPCPAPGIYKAMLELKFTGPTQCRVGDRYNYTVSIKNSGSETAENVVINYTLPIGISLISDPSNKDFSISAGDMAPGSAKKFNIEVNADYAGIFINNVYICGDNTHEKHSSICTKVINRRGRL